MYRKIFSAILLLSHTMLACAHIDNSAKISLALHEMNLRDVLEYIGEFSGKNVVISSKIHNNVSLNLKQVTWREALDLVLQMQHLIKRETKNTITIMAANELSKTDTEITQPKLFNLHYTQAENIAKILKPAGVLSTTGNAGAEQRSNSLIVTDNQATIAAVADLINKIDIPVKQILIEAKIVSADTNFTQELGLKFGTSNNNATDVTTPNFTQGQFTFTLAKFANDNLLDLELQALETEGRGKVISSPKLLTTERQVAYIESGAEIPYQEKTKEGDTSVAFKKAVLSLKVTPEIVAPKTLSLTLQLNQDKVSQLTVNGVPAIDTRQIQTQVLVHNGETIVLGGIYEYSVSKNISQIPLLGNIPILGLLFRNTENKLERKELLIFVTPRIVG